MEHGHKKTAILTGAETAVCKVLKPCAYYTKKPLRMQCAVVRMTRPTGRKGFHDHLFQTGHRPKDERDAHARQQDFYPATKAGIQAFQRFVCALLAGFCFYFRFHIDSEMYPRTEVFDKIFHRLVVHPVNFVSLDASTSQRPVFSRPSGGFFIACICASSCRN